MESRLIVRQGSAWLLALVTVVGIIGCETDSFMDPTAVGRWEHTPVKLPILKRLDVIDEAMADPPNLTQVMPEDLVPHPYEYVIGSGDMLAISVFELQAPGADTVLQRIIDDLGIFRHPILGPIHVSGMTPSKLETHVAEITRRQGLLNEPQVSVLVLQGRQNTFSVLGQPGMSVGRIGTLPILGPDYRLLDAIAAAGSISPFVNRLFIIRQATLDSGSEVSTIGLESELAPQPATLIEQLIMGEEDSVTAEGVDQPEAGPPAPKALERSLDSKDESNASRVKVKVEDEWVDVSKAPAAIDGSDEMDAQELDGEPQLPTLVQRVIEIPYDQLRKGDLRYNVVIRPGDVIHIPSTSSGNVYLAGRVMRPGTYNLPGLNRLTIKQLMASAGGFGPTGVPERVDLTRRIGIEHEATVRLNLRAIFHGTEPDIFLKPDDLLNIGTNFLATPVAVIRRGFRTTYGFGFILDRNFGPDVFRELDASRRNFLRTN